MEATITFMPPYQLMAGVSFFPEEFKDGKHYWNEFTVYIFIFSIKLEW
jgi:hypothetical protein